MFFNLFAFQLCSKNHLKSEEKLNVITNYPVKGKVYVV